MRRGKEGERSGSWKFLVYIVSNVSTLNIYVHQVALEERKGRGRVKTLSLPSLSLLWFLSQFIFWYILSLYYNLADEQSGVHVVTRPFVGRNR